ncbi:MAG: hypothetical protein IKJ07_07980 [Clostridia bacterium]|nr:hypothetical protein [Clostridia bacterium]
MIKRIILLITVLLTILSLLSGCENETTVETNCSTDTVTKTVVAGREIYFVSDATKKEWKEPLAKLLSNVLVPYGAHGEIIGYEAAVDPDAPTLPGFYECGLVDITKDSTPELIIAPFSYAGSSGNSTYLAYNIFTGQLVGKLSGGFSQSWCEYYYSETDELKLVGQFWVESGVSDKEYYILTTEFNEEFGAYPYLQTSHEIEISQEYVTDEESGGYPVWVEKTTGIHYYIDLKEVTQEIYDAEYNWFERNCIKIPETELILIQWSDVTEEDDDYVTKGAKMAEALVNSKQEFIDFCK